MQDNDTTSGASPPDIAFQFQIEQVLAEAIREIPLISLPGNLSVAAKVIPFSIGKLKPLCTYATIDGEHSIPSRMIWKDLETGWIYCTLVCAASDAILRADKTAEDDRKFRELTRDA